MRIARFAILLGACTSNPAAPTTPSSSSTHRLAAGAQFTCAIHAGTVECWGESREGALGVGLDFKPHASPMTSGVSAIAIVAGDQHVCAIDPTGGVSCWGADAGGQLGAPPQYDTSQVHVSLPSSAVLLAAGARHSCALLTDQSVWCWGDNTSGQLGTSGGPSLVPQHVLDSSISLAAAGDHTCAVQSDHTVWCWGANDRGELGDGTTAGHSTPTPVTGITAVAVAAGTHHTCALGPTGDFACWGSNASGQLGDGSNVDRTVPGPAIALAATALFAGADRTCALTVDQRLLCWGANANGELGDGTAIDRSVPTPALVSGEIVDVGVGGSHTCSRRADDTLACWGFGSIGQLGNGTIAPMVPQAALISANASAIAAGRHHVCASIGSARQVYCWGDDHLRQLGDDGSIAGTASATPIAVGLDHVVALSAASDHTCARRDDGTAWCWGDNRDGGLGDGTTTPRVGAVQVAGLAGVVELATGDGFTCATTTAATSCVGRDDVGQLGDGGGAAKLSPIVVGTALLSSLTAGSTHACGLQNGDQVVCWGGNAHGQIGNSDFGPASLPAGPTGAFTQVSAASDHTCAFRAPADQMTDAMWCWGRRDYLGGTSGVAPVPDAHAPVTDFGSSLGTSVTAGWSDDCVGVGMTQECFGGNEFGELADTLTEAEPGAMIGGTSGTAAVGDGFICGLYGGVISCAGDNAHGELGLGWYSGSLTPVEVTL